MRALLGPRLLEANPAQDTRDTPAFLIQSERANGDRLDEEGLNLLSR